ncbi:MAG: hypothetical protein DRP85_03685 [Candidatus Makaraimicrobium thalassicum]|nr:MAG: hypothetical protein DRP85_03685 [Candidatus Omnitrophota bacterium]
MKSPVKKGAIFASIALIIVLGFAVYGNSLGGDFLWDDGYLVEDNAYTRDWSHTGDFFSGEQSTKTIAPQFSFYRPFQMITYVMDYSLWGLDVRGYHLTNILLHVSVALALFWMVNILFGDVLLSFLTGLFFVTHPVHTEAVSYISGRSDPLAALFMLLCFIFYVKELNSQKKRFYFLMILAYIGALLSRETAMILVALLLLYHFVFGRKIEFKGFLSLSGITFIYILLRLTALRGLLAVSAVPTHFSQRFPGFFAAITGYTRLLTLPVHLHMEYGAELFKLSEPETITGVLLVLFFLVYAWGKRKSSKLLFFSVFWFFLALLPVSNLYPVNAYMAEHWLYLPSIGFFLLLAGGVCWLYRSRSLKICSMVLMIYIPLFYAYSTVKQNGYWSDRITFYERTLRYAPDSVRVHNNLGNAYLKAGRKEEAIASYKNALAVDPGYAEAYYNLGSVYVDTGRKEEAISLFKKAVMIDPDYAEAYYNLGNAYVDTGREKEAIAFYEKALEVDPDYAEAYNNLGVAYAAAGRRDEAVASYRKALAINPAHAGAYTNLGIVYAAAGKNEEAIAMYTKALRIDPDFAAAYNNLAAAYYYEGQYARAIRYCDKAVKLGLKVPPKLLEMLEPYREE